MIGQQLQTLNIGSSGMLALPSHLVNAPSVVGDIPTGDSRTRIGLKGREFHIIRGGVEEGVVDTKYLDVVIVGAQPYISRSYYGKAYVEGEATAPSCYSVDGNVPAADVRNPQNDKCMSCPQNQDGSSVAGDKKSKACGFFRRVAVVTMGYDDWTVFQMDVKSMSLWGESQGAQFAFQEYAKKLKSHNVDPGHVITRMTFDPSVGVPKLLFQAMGFVDAEQLARVLDLVSSGQVAPAIEVSMATFDGANAQTVVPEAAEPARAAAPAPQRPAPTLRQPTPAPAVQAASAAPAAQDTPTLKRPTLLRPAVVHANVPLPATEVQSQEEQDATVMQQINDTKINYPPKNRPGMPLKTITPAARQAPAPAPAAASNDELEALLAELS